MNYFNQSGKDDITDIPVTGIKGNRQHQDYLDNTLNDV